MKSSPPQGIEIAPANEIHHVRAPNGSDSSIFSKISSFGNFGVIDHRCVATYNFFVWQRLTVILSENKKSNILQLRDFKTFPGFILFDQDNLVQRSKIHTLDKRNSLNNRPR